MIINGIRWSVRLVTPSHPMLFTPWRTHALGVCDKTTRTIYIDKTLSRRQLRETLCHEIVHAIMFSYQIDLTYEEEEMVAELISYYGDEIIKLTTVLYDGIKMK